MNINEYLLNADLVFEVHLFLSISTPYLRRSSSDVMFAYLEVVFSFSFFTAISIAVKCEGF